MSLASPVRLSVILGALALVPLFAVDSSANMTGKSFLQKASSAPGMSKVIFNSKIGQGGADSDVFYSLDPCITSPTPEIHIKILNSNGTFSFVPVPANAVWDAQCAQNVPGKDKALLDTGNCKFKYIAKFNDGGILVKGKFVAKCLLAVDVAPILEADISFVFSAELDDICFGTAAGGFVTNPATVKKDGSDGKVVKLINAPLTACENP